LLQSAPIEHRDLATPIADYTLLLQFAGGLGYALPAHPKDIGNEILSHR
jgi:hypothetical protein